MKYRFRTLIFNMLLLALSVLSNQLVMGQSALRLSARVDESGMIRCDSDGPTNKVYLLEKSSDLGAWEECARIHDKIAQFPLGSSGTREAAFFRAVARPKTSSDDWKNQVLAASDPFLSESGSLGGSESRWLKFTIRLDKPNRVYFQDSAKYPFHYQFAVNRMDGFQNLSPEAFDEISLNAAGQKLALGAVVFPADPATREIGIQIVGRQPFAIQHIAEWFQLVRSVIVISAGWSVYYMPTFEQDNLTTEDAAFLTTRGIMVSSPARWVRGDDCYSAGWAYGRLKFVKAGEIASAYASGQLWHSDILLTDAVPAEIPLLAGTISLTPATPNSHVAILSQSFGVPFVYIASQRNQETLRAWDGQEVMLLADRTANGGSVKTINVQNQLTDSQKEKLLRAKQPPALKISPITSKGAISLPVRGLTLNDVRFIGGKAANFSLLMQAIPDNAPRDAIAFTFDLWNAFFDQVRPDGKILRAVIQEKLRPYVFPPDMVKLTKDLADIRSLIRNEADFTLNQKTAILAALSPFDPQSKLRFRSSTNVEDSDQFSGAGLYDSYSGCLVDDTDGDSDGPSHCDPSETGERGVFRALRRVYASFYNDNAFIQRLRHGVNEAEAGMAVLVHYSFPDERELANGVATLRATAGNATNLVSLAGELVTQKGAISVANPEGNALPEVVAATRSANGQPTFEIQRRSSLIPLGGTVLDWPEEYRQIFNLLEIASHQYALAIPSRNEFVLDLEYKKIEPGRLVVKQIRQVPTALTPTNTPPFLLNDAGRLVVFQHHGKDLYANHRLKSVWQFQALVFKDDPGVAGFNFLADVEYHNGAALSSFSGRMNTLSNASITMVGKTLKYAWKRTDGTLQGNYQLTAEFSKDLKISPPVSLSEALLIELSASYANPQAKFDYDGKPSTATTEKTRLVPLEKIVDGSLERHRVFKRRQVAIDTKYTLAFLKFNVPGIGIYDGKSFPLLRWGGTTITGLTSQPFSLRGTYSQTYDSIRHNFQETFIFEPRLEEGINPAILTELLAANIKAVRISQFTADTGSQPDIRIWGFDDRLRVLE